jgi:formate-dependent nitrite reductase membrane component NrfD
LQGNLIQLEGNTPQITDVNLQQESWLIVGIWQINLLLLWSCVWNAVISAKVWPIRSAAPMCKPSKQPLACIKPWFVGVQFWKIKMTHSLKFQYVGILGNLGFEHFKI